MLSMEDVVGAAVMGKACLKTRKSGSLWCSRSIDHRKRLKPKPTVVVYIEYKFYYQLNGYELWLADL